MNRQEYRRFLWIASVSIAVFIVSFAICLLAYNRSVYRVCTADFDTGEAVEMSGAEAALYYDQIADSYCSFFKGGYTVAGYELSQANIHQLNRLKGYYRMAWILSLVSFGCAVYSLRRLWRRRETMPYFYGSALAACLTAFLMIRMVFSKKEVYTGLRNMVFRGDYSYFSGNDILHVLLPETFARNLALLYLGIVAVEIFVVVMIRVVIRFAGRPHRF